MEKEDLLWALSPMFTINALSGIPIIRYGASCGEKWALFSLVGYTFLFCLSSFIPLYMIISLGMYYLPVDLALVVNFFWAAIVLISSSISGFTHLFKRKQVTDIFLGLSQLGESTVGIFPVKQIRRLIIIQSAAFLLGMVIVTSLSIKSVPSESFSLNTLYVYLHSFWNTVLLEQEWQFYNVLSLLSVSVQGLNDRMIYLLSRKTSNIRKKKFMRDISHLKSLLLDSHNIYITAERSYGIPNVVIGLQTLLRLSFLLYSIFDSGMFEFNVDWSLVSIFGSIIVMITGLFIETFVFTANHQLKKEVDKTQRIVIEGMLKVEDYSKRRELRLFVLQLFHTQFRSTACGLNPLDLTTFTAMAATVVAYLVILVQFKNFE